MTQTKWKIAPSAAGIDHATIVHVVLTSLPVRNGGDKDVLRITVHTSTGEAEAFCAPVLDDDTFLGKVVKAVNEGKIPDKLPDVEGRLMNCKIRVQVRREKGNDGKVFANIVDVFPYEAADFSQDVDDSWGEHDELLEEGDEDEFEDEEDEVDEVDEDEFETGDDHSWDDPDELLEEEDPEPAPVIPQHRRIRG